ncbi:MAG: C1 family peptidase [Bacteroidota bacterium]
MPIRMEEDPQGQKRQNDNSGKGGGLSSLMRFLPLILLFVFKRPKLILPLLLVGAVWYFFFGGADMLNSFASEGGGQNQYDTSQFSLGASLSEAEYDKAKVFAPLAYGSQNQLPRRVSLERFAPRRMHQGKQGSCVGWASAYAARTILEAQAKNADPNSNTFSPAYLYNQIHLDGCQGAYMINAMRTMADEGSLPFREFRYDDRTCSNYPSSSQINKGRQYRIKGYNRLSLGGSNYKTDLMAIKQNIAQGAPVVIGMMVGGSFMSRMVGQKLWRPTQSDYSQRGYSGHAMCVIGYNDDYEGGSFQIMNSWGEDWGDDGIAWVRYKDFDYFTKEAYGLHPMGSGEKYDDSKLAVEFGLLDLASQSTLSLKRKDDIVFQTTKPISKGDKFKVLIANSIECNIYIFGRETDGSSYVLFPYTDKHSPYCGITGTRLFPKDYSMVADDKGNKDYIAIVISKNEINFDQFNRAINQSRQSTYAGKVKEALGSQRITGVNFRAGSTIAFDADRKGKNAVGMVIEIDKM